MKSDRPCVLVTGACGNIGRLCTPEWEKTMNLRLTDLNVPAGDSRYVAADLMNFSEAWKLMDGVDTVVHLAMAPGTTPRNPTPFAEDEANPAQLLQLRINTEMTYNIFEAARRRGVRRVVYMSSFTVYLGDRHQARYDLETPLEPANLYACTKLFGENLARLYWRSHGLGAICLRLGQPFPIGNATYDDSWKTNKRARSNFVEIRDVAHAVACAVSAEVDFGIYPIVSASDNPRVDLESAARDLGYTPRYYLSDDGLVHVEDGRFPKAGPVVTHNPGELP